jgi:hypothetical protein
MKKCIECGILKQEDGFVLHDGYLSNKCRDCINVKRRETRAKNAEKIRAYDRQYSQRPDRVAYSKKRYERLKTDKRNKAMVEARIARWQAKNREKVTAHRTLNNAITAGKISRKPCERCGIDEGVEGHHEDYSKPLEVIWLCKMHHNERHREINEQRRQQRTNIGTISDNGETLGRG